MNIAENEVPVDKAYQQHVHGNGGHAKRRSVSHQGIPDPSSLSGGSGLAALVEQPADQLSHDQTEELCRRLRRVGLLGWKVRVAVGLVLAGRSIDKLMHATACACIRFCMFTETSQPHGSPEPCNDPRPSKAETARPLARSQDRYTGPASHKTALQSAQTSPNLAHGPYQHQPQAFKAQR